MINHAQASKGKLVNDAMFCHPSYSTVDYTFLVSFPDPPRKEREGLGDRLTSMRSGGIHGMQLYYTS